MECESSYADGFLKYLKDFVANIRSDDPLPVRAPSYKVTESEIDGQILDIVHHYLNSRECPPYVREYVGHRVWTDIRNPGVNGDGMEDEVDSTTSTPSTNNSYDAMKLIQEVTGKANDVIREMANGLTPDQVEKLPRYHPISHFAIKNTRRKMEDRHIIIHDLNTLYGMNFGYPHAYYGVFDGHAGTDAAVYSAAHLHQYMMQNPQYETNPEAALKHAFHITDTNFIKKVTKERLKGGTTAVVALVREKRLVVAWLGDSQALLVRRRNPVRMVEPHKPELPVERERVEELGGCVINIQGTWRVLGQLAVSRAIGDADYKPYVSSECDIKSLEIEGDEDFLILACDGLWDTLSADDAVNIVYAYLNHNNGDTDGVGRCLVEGARSAGSEDNITAVVVFLRPVATLMEEEAQRIAQGQVPDSVPAVMMEKDSTPSSINAIFSPPFFSPPINQFELSESKLYGNSETAEAVFGMNNHHNDSQEAVVTLTSEMTAQEGKDEPMEGSEAPEMPPHDSDSDEGVAVGAEGAQVTEAFNPHDAPTPTAEEVDAALAELDSIPDGVCESGEVEEEEEDEEEWSYYRMDPQSHPQSEDVLPGGVPTSDSAPAPLENTDIPLEPSVMVHDKDIAPVPEDKFQDQTSYNFELNKDFIDNLPEIPSQHEPIAKCPSPLEAEIAPLADKKSETFERDMDIDSNFSANTEILSNFPESEFKKANIEPSSPHGSGSPRAPGSPRSVEGFVTSVELNTPDESFATNFAVNQSQDLFAGVVDQPSGPFSVYVSSSPEPASLDPPALASVDLLDMNGGMTNGEEHAPLNQTPQLCEESPVEIVHAQSTVEVVAPPSPVEISGPETQFIPDPSSAPILPADITFVPLPVTEPTAEEPVPVYVDDTPVSEPEVIPDSQIVTDSEFNAGIVIQNTEEVGSESEIQKETNMSFESSQISTEESFTTEMASLTATMAINESTEETKLDESQTPESPRPEVSPVEPVPAIPIHDTALSVDPALITSSLVETEVVCAPTNDIPEVASEVVETLAPAVPAATKATKTAKTPARPAADKAPAKATPNKTTPSRATPGKATPVKTPVTKTPSTRTPTAKTPITKSAEKKTPTPRTTITSSTSRPASAKPAIPKTTTTTRKPLENKSEVSKPTTTKPAARPPSAKSTAIRAPPSTTKAAEKPTTKPAATGAPRTAAFGPTRPRQTLTTKSSAATPAAKKPLTASKSGDKTDSSKLVNGSSSRPSSLSASARSTTTTTARKSLASTKAPAKPAAEKETKNTTNQMLSTRPAKAAPATGRTTTTKMASVHSATRTTSKVSESSSTVKSRVTSTTKSTATKTTGAATKKTLVSKTKASATGAKQTSVKTKTEAAVIDKTEPLVNGENKIADEETSVEVIEKCAVEDIVQASAEMIITETVSASEQVIVSSETTEVLVNGDH